MSTTRRYSSRSRTDVEALKAEIEGLGNPYLDAWVTVTGGVSEAQSYSLTGADVEHYIDAYQYRAGLVSYYAWAVPDEEALLKLDGGTGEVVEVGAGGGYWAALLRARGVTVHPYDRQPGDSFWAERLWTPVAVGGARAAARHPGATLFLCWPPYRSRLAEVALGFYLRAGGRRVVYVGEGRGAACADDGFFDALERLRQVDEHYLPQWPGIHDELSVWEVPS